MKNLDLRENASLVIGGGDTRKWNTKETRGKIKTKMRVPHWIISVSITVRVSEVKIAKI